MKFDEIPLNCGNRAKCGGQFEMGKSTDGKIIETPCVGHGLLFPFSFFLFNSLMGSVVAGNNSATNHVKTWFGSKNRCIEFIFCPTRIVSDDQFLILSGHVQQLHLTPFNTLAGASIYAGFKTQMARIGTDFAKVYDSFFAVLDCWPALKLAIFGTGEQFWLYGHNG